MARKWWPKVATISEVHCIKKKTCYEVVTFDMDWFMLGPTIFSQQIIAKFAIVNLLHMRGWGVLPNCPR